MKFITLPIAIGLGTMLSACVSPQPLVRDVLSDPEKHLSTSIVETKLAEPVRKKVGINGLGNVKRNVQIDMVMTNIDGDNKKSFDQKNTYHVLDNGLVRRMVVGGNNGIPSYSEFLLDYHGITNLIYQYMSHSAGNVYSPSYLKEVKRWDIGINMPKENSEYVFEYASAPEIQIINFPMQTTTCKTGKWFPANTIHAKLPGMALLMDCEYVGQNGQVFLKRSNAVIKDLGIVLARESTSSDRKRAYTVTDVKY